MSEIPSNAAATQAQVNRLWEAVQTISRKIEITNERIDAILKMIEKLPIQRP